MPRKPFVGGNFKAAAGLAGVKAQVAVLNAMDLPSNVEVVVAPSALHVDAVKSSIRPEVGVAIQDVHYVKAMGAYTGSHTVDQVKEFGIPWVLVGHSERRSIWGETDEQTATKTKIAIEAGLKVIFCVGESLAEREAGKTDEVVHRQVQALVAAIPAGSAWESIVIAYEPVWAIGTGKVATTEQAQEAHKSIREFMAAKLSAEVAANTRILYGGSVNAANSAGLSAQADIDGFLVGGASLKPEFADIIKNAAAAPAK